MRRVHLRHRQNILKRVLIHVGAFNLSLIMRKTLGHGTSRGSSPSFFIFSEPSHRRQVNIPSHISPLLGPRDSGFCHGLLYRLRCAPGLAHAYMGDDIIIFA